MIDDAILDLVKFECQVTADRLEGMLTLVKAPPAPLPIFTFMAEASLMGDDGDLR